MRWKCAAAMLAMLAGMGVATAAAQDERILSYHSDVTVQPNGWLTVTETIQVRATGRKIKHGIYRDFPTGYVGRDRAKIKVPFEIVRVERNGRSEPWRTTSKPPYKRVYIGSKNKRLKPGAHTYRLTYRTARQLGFFAGHDELFWNVTGTRWDFPIDAASAAVTLPKGVPADKIGVEGYTGLKNAKGKDYSAGVNADAQAVFRSTRPLAKHEGLTIVVTFPKGFVVEPTWRELLCYLLTDNSMILVGLIGLAIVTGYYLLAWLKVGRDPATGTIIPLFDPPDGLSPASVRYILRMGYDKACFAASILSLAVKNHLRIENDDGDFVLQRQTGDGQAELSRDEKKVARRLLGDRSQLTLVNSNHAIFSETVAKLKKILAEDHKGKHFYSNVNYAVPGIILTVLTIVGIALLGFVQDGNPVVGFLTVWLAGWSVGVFLLVGSAISAWKSVVVGKTGALGRAGKTGGAMFLTLFSIPFVAAEVAVLGILGWMTSIWMLPILLLVVAVNALFFYLLKRPTPEGRKLMDRIEGFKMYLETSERDLLNYVHPPEKTPELYERYLPYALAMGVENAWSKKFSDILARAAAEGYQPGWYHGAAWGAVGATGFAASLGSSFSSALSSASSAPGSSSGAGGGGSSGGGGGGGGGGGW